MFAVIKTGGKQYAVTPDQKIQIEKVIGAAGEKISFDEVLLINDGDATTVGTPMIAGAKVQGEVIEQGRDKKKIVFTYKSKTRQRTKKGHRQPYTEIKILSIAK